MTKFNITTAKKKKNPKYLGMGNKEPNIVL